MCGFVGFANFKEDISGIWHLYNNKIDISIDNA